MQLNIKFYLKILTLSLFVIPCYLNAAEADKPGNTDKTEQVTKTYKISLLPDSQLKLEGDSTLHPYESSATVLQLNTQISFKNDENFLTVLQLIDTPDKFVKSSNISFVIPIKKMKSPTLGLDPNLHRTLKSKQYPNIVFDVTSYSAEKSKESSDKYDISINGNLSLAGKTIPLTVKMKSMLKDGKVLYLEGEQDLLMTSFGIEPPELFFGTIKVKDQIKIKWNLNLVLESEQSSKTPTK